MSAEQHPFDEHIAERFFTKPAPMRDFPAHSQDPNTALALLESEVVLDGDPHKNLATFVTTFMEPNAILVITDAGREEDAVVEDRVLPIRLELQRAVHVPVQPFDLP